MVNGGPQQAFPPGCAEQKPGMEQPRTPVSEALAHSPADPRLVRPLGAGVFRADAPPAGGRVG